VPNRNTLIAAGALFAFVVVAIGGYSIGRGSASADALAANRRADSLAVVIAERLPQTDAVLAGNTIVVDSAARLVAKGNAPKRRVQTVNVAALPDTCQPIVQTILADAETVFVTDSAALALHEAQNVRLTNELTETAALLEASRAELRAQSTRIQAPPPKKLLGLVPMPSLTAGYGATLVGGRVQTGPQVGVSFKVVL
jgi:hypothetical protein